MRIIDERGRLFHKINIIDLFVVIMIGVLTVSFMINLPYIIKSWHRPATEEMYVKVLYMNVSSYVLENNKILQPGDTLLGGNATVERVLKTTPGITIDMLNANNKLTGYWQARSSSDIIVLIRANCVKLRGENYCANAQIKINSLLSLDNELYVLRDGVIIDVNTGSDAAN